MPGQFEIDVVATSATLKKWEARTVWNNKPLCKSNGEPITGVSAELVQHEIAQLYERRVGPWREFKGAL